MKNNHTFFEKWKNDYDFSTVMGAVGSLAVTVLFALFNGFLGVYYASLWYGTYCAYYILLVVLRAWLINARKKAAKAESPNPVRNKAYMVAAVLLLVLNISLVVPVTLMVVQQRPVGMTLIPAIAMATYTTYKIIMASVNLRRRRRSLDCLVRLLRTISFIDALVSVLILQNTLIMVQTKGESSEMLPLTATSTAAVMAMVLLLCVGTIVQGVRNFRSENDSK